MFNANAASAGVFTFREGVWPLVPFRLLRRFRRQWTRGESSFPRWLPGHSKCRESGNTCVAMQARRSQAIPERLSSRTKEGNREMFRGKRNGESFGARSASAGFNFDSGKNFVSGDKFGVNSSGSSCSICL